MRPWFPNLPFLLVTFFHHATFIHAAIPTLSQYLMEATTHAQNNISFHEEFGLHNTSLLNQSDTIPSPWLGFPDLEEQFNSTFSHLPAKLSRKMKREVQDDDDAPPSIPPNVCLTTPQELASLNSVLFETLVKMMTFSTDTTTSCHSHTTPAPPPSTLDDCRLLISYMATTTRKIACENALLKKMNSVSDSNYLNLEAKYEAKILNLQSVLGKLRQNKGQVVSQLKSDYDQKLHLLQARVTALLKEVKELKKALNQKMMTLVVERIEASKSTQAVEEYRKLTISRDISLPAILERVYIPGNNERAGQIGKFIANLAYIEEQIVAVNAWQGLMRARNQLTSPSVLILHYLLDNVSKMDKFPEVLGSLRTLTQTLKNTLRSQADSVLSTMAHNIKSGEYAETLAFSTGANTFSYFIPYTDTVTRAAYTGLNSLDQILPFLRTIPTIYPKIPMFTSLLKVMKERGHLYSEKGLEVIYTISQWSNVASDAGLAQEIPSTLNLFGGKHCVFKNLDKSNEFLAASSEIRHSGERRLVVTHPNSWSEGNNAKWILKSQDWGKTFEILNVQYGEYLYAAGDYYKYDSDRRSVFTWVPGGRVTQGVWELEPYSNGGKFKVKNVAHGEKLYAATDRFQYYKDWRRVFTWGKKWEDHNDEYWTIRCG